MHRPTILRAALVLVVSLGFGTAQPKLMGAPSATPVAPVSHPCPRYPAGSVVHNSEALFSSGGILNVRFSYQTTTDAYGRTLFCFMTPDGLQNPTLHIKPGDQLVITITNNTPAGMNPMTINPPNCGSVIMDSSSVNIHYHGTNTSPVCGQDEVIKTAINAGETFQYEISFPSNEPPGLYWYHPHVHGIAEAAVLGGASGAIVVEGIENVQPAVSGLRQRILVIRDQPQVQGLPEGSGGCTNDVPFQDLTINNVPIDSNQAVPGGRVTFIPAVLRMEAEGREFWRVTNSSADTILDLQVQYDRIPQTVQLVAIDGVSVNSQDGTQPSRLIPAQHFRLPPASRVEFIVASPSAHVRTAQLVTTSISTGAKGDCDPFRPIANLQAVEAGDTGDSDKDGRVGAYTALSAKGQRFSGLGSAPIAQSRLVYFDENTSTNQFYMVVAGQPEQVFNPNAPPAIIATQGTVEEWTVENHALENHEFHFHQVHFLLESQNHFAINGQPEAPAVVGQYLDMVEVPGWDGNPAHPYPNVKVRIDFRGPDIGSFVFHCHILNHEDLGMMNIIQVVAPTASNSAPAKPAVAMNAGPVHAKSSSIAALAAGKDGGTK